MQSLTELRLTLASLQDQIGGLHEKIDGCVEFLDALTGGVPIPLPRRAGRPAKAKTNGGAGKAISADLFREQVRSHYTNHRRKTSIRAPKNPALSLDAALEVARKKHKGVAEPSPGTLTTQEVAKRLRLSDAGVRNLVADGRLPEPRLELRRFGSFHSFRPTVVHRIADIEAYSVGRLAQGPPPRGIHAARPAPAANAPAKRVKMSKLAQRRQATIDYLTQYDRHQPRMIPGVGLGPLVRRGYLKKKGDGYIRTAKEYHLSLAKTKRLNAQHALTVADRPKKKSAPGTWKTTVQAKRQATMDMLAKFDTEEPRPTTIVENHRVVGVMVQHGYLKPKDGGYVRTGKEYHP